MAKSETTDDGWQLQPDGPLKGHWVWYARSGPDGTPNPKHLQMYVAINGAKPTPANIIIPGGEPWSGWGSS